LLILGPDRISSGWFDEIAADTILVFVSSSSPFLRKRSECPNNNFRRVDRCDNRSEQRGRARRGCRVEGQRQGRNTISENQSARSIPLLFSNARSIYVDCDTCWLP